MIPAEILVQHYLEHGTLNSPLKSILIYSVKCSRHPQMWRKHIKVFVLHVERGWSGCHGVSMIQDIFDLKEKQAHLCKLRRSYHWKHGLLFRRQIDWTGQNLLLRLPSGGAPLPLCRWQLLRNRCLVAACDQFMFLLGNADYFHQFMRIMNSAVLLFHGHSVPKVLKVFLSSVRSFFFLTNLKQIISFKSNNLRIACCRPLKSNISIKILMKYFYFILILLLFFFFF